MTTLVLPSWPLYPVPINCGHCNSNHVCHFCWLFQGIIKLKPLTFSLLAAVSHFSRNTDTKSQQLFGLYVARYQARKVKHDLMTLLVSPPPPPPSHNLLQTIVGSIWGQLVAASVAENNCDIIRRGNPDLNHPTWGTKQDTYRQFAPEPGKAPPPPPPADI